MSHSGGNKAVVAALLANTGIALTKFVAFLLTGFSSMLAESIHSLADSGNQVLLLVGAKRSKREATSEHPFGFGRERYIYAFVVAIVLFSLGGVFTLYESIEKFLELRHHAEDIGGGWQHYVPVGVLGVAIVLESLSFRTAIIEGRQAKGDHSWVQYIRYAKAPELPVILLEDFAALVGLAFAFVAVGLTLLTGDPVYDVIGSGAIGLLLIVVAVVLTREVRSLLIGESASESAQAAIHQAIEGTEGVRRVIHLKTLHIGPEEVLVAAKVDVDPDMRAGDLAAMIDEAERRLRSAEPMAEHVFIEPDIHREGHQTDARPQP